MTPQRRLPQFRVAVNSRCGRACFFCRPSGEGIKTAPGTDISPAALLRIASSVRRHGVDSIKLTGGDPALYQPLVDVVAALKEEAGFSKVEVISRHPSIGLRSADLKLAGVDLLNISLDTLDRTKYKQICGVDDLDELLLAIQACVSAGLTVKVNTVVMLGINDGEVFEIVERCTAMGVKTVKLLDVIEDLDQGDESFTARLRGRASDLRSLYTPFDSIVEKLESMSLERAVHTQGDLGHPMTAYRLPGGVEVLVKDSRAGAWYGDICRGCAHYPCHDALMALRLTADLRLQYCLLRSDNVADLSEALSSDDVADVDRLVGRALGHYSQTEFVVSRRRIALPLVVGA